MPLQLYCSLSLWSELRHHGRTVWTKSLVKVIAKQLLVSMAHTGEQSPRYAWTHGMLTRYHWLTSVISNVRDYQLIMHDHEDWYLYIDLADEAFHTICTTWTGHIWKTWGMPVLCQQLQLFCTLRRSNWAEYDKSCLWCFSEYTIWYDTCIPWNICSYCLLLIIWANRLIT